VTLIEVFADVTCPFAHVGLRRFVERRSELGRRDVVLIVRAWPLEIVNGQPLDGHHAAESVRAIREQIAPSLFAGFAEAAFPRSSLGALALAAAAYDQGPGVGERVSMALRDLVFEQGVDVADDEVLDRLAAEHHLAVDLTAEQRVLEDHAEGVSRGVIGSPHFFTPVGDFFCPALEIHRDAERRLRIRPDAQRFDRFVSACLG